MRTIEKTNYGYLLAVQSVNDKKYPFDSDYVRGIFRTGLQIIPVTDHVVQVVMFGHIDPRGWIPEFMVNYHIDTSADWIGRV